MGPQLCSCGNDRKGVKVMLSSSELQWGRNFAVAETPTTRHRIIQAPLLQWGRNFAVAETIYTDTEADDKVWLQWGRNFAVAET